MNPRARQQRNRSGGRKNGAKNGAKLDAKSDAKTDASADGKRFDARYYAKWYGDRAERAGIARRALRFVLSYIDHMDADIATALDLGCGLGLWKKALASQAPDVRYTGVEYSPYLCAKYGWHQGDVCTYSPGRAFDLVICQGVLQYLNDADCAAAIENLARLSRRFLYLEALTAADAEEVCCPDGTDFDVHLRDAKWYAARLRKHFVNLGGGLYATPRMRDHYFELWCTG
jgi:SAM-dependent methyltransferase